MWGSFGVRELRCEGVALWESCIGGSCGVGELQCGSFDLGELRCGGVALWGSCAVGESSTETNITPKWRKIAKFLSQILLDNLKSYSKRTYFF